MNTRRNFIKAAGITLVATRLASADDSSVKRIYIAADDHTDYMWTANEKVYRETFLKTIDHYLNLADQTDDRESAFQSRWNCDGLLWFYEYEQNRSTENTKRLVQRIKSGHISVPMTMLVSCYGGMPTEAAIRGLFYGGHVQRKYEIELPIAVAMENQTLPYGLGMLWAGSGVKYSWKGICGCASKLKHSGSNRKHDVYWWVGPDGSRILMKWYSMAQPLRRGLYWNEGPGGYAEARHPQLAIHFVDSDPTFIQKNPQNVIGLFGQGWDDLKTIVPLEDPENSFPAVAKKMTTDTRRVIVSNELDYFEDFEKNHGDDLPEVSCSFGNEWELYNASLAEVSASVKRATEKLRAAEAMAVLVEKHRPNFADALNQRKQKAWIAFGLYWEHDWTADGPVSKRERERWQRKIAGQITSYVDGLYDLASTKIAELVDSHGFMGSIVVFNPLGWRRDAIAEVPVDGATVEVVDLQSDQTMVSQVNQQDDSVTLQFMARDLPPFGYRVYQIRDIKSPVDNTGNSKELKTTFDGRTLSSEKHSVTIAENGSISSWNSQSLGKTSLGKMSLGKTLIGDDQVGNHLEAAKGSVKQESSGPVSTTVRVNVARPIRRQTRVTFYEDSDRIDIENQIQESFVETEKWRFEFNLDSPSTIHEEVGAIIRAATKIDGGHYANSNARTDWLTLNHFVTLQDENAAVMIANRDCLFFHLGEKVTDPMDSDSSTVHVLAGGQIDGKKLGIRGQGGDRLFTQRFSLLAGKSLSATESMKASMEFSNPPIVIRLTGSGDKLNAKSDSLIEIESDDVVIWAVKPAEQLESAEQIEPAGQGRAGQGRAGQGRRLFGFGISLQRSQRIH